MNRFEILYMVFFLVLSMLGYGQEVPNENGYHYYPLYAEAYTDFGSNSRDETLKYRAYGAEARFGWGTDETQRFQFCGLWSAGAGYGSRVKPDRDFYLPFLISLAFSGSVKIAEKQSVGLVYDFIDIYGWSQRAMAGSQIGFTYRNRMVQMELSRTGEGLGTGAFYRKYDQQPVFTANVGIWIYRQFQVHSSYLWSNQDGMRQARMGIRYMF